MSLWDSYWMVIGSLLHGLVVVCLLAGYVLVIGWSLAAHVLSVVIGSLWAGWLNDWSSTGWLLAAYGLVLLVNPGKL